MGKAAVGAFLEEFDIPGLRFVLQKASDGERACLAPGGRLWRGTAGMEFHGTPQKASGGEGGPSSPPSGFKKGGSRTAVASFVSVKFRRAPVDESGPTDLSTGWPRGCPAVDPDPHFFVRRFVDERCARHTPSLKG